MFSSQVQLPSSDEMYQSLRIFEQSIRDRDLYLREPTTVQSSTKANGIKSQKISGDTSCSSNSRQNINHSVSQKGEEVEEVDMHESKRDRNSIWNYHFLGGDLQIQYLQNIVYLCGNSLPEARRERLLQYIELLRQIYEDVTSNRPAFVGAPDHYRRRNYRVDNTTLTWSLL